MEVLLSTGPTPSSLYTNIYKNEQQTERSRRWTHTLRVDAFVFASCTNIFFVAVPQSNIKSLCCTHTNKAKLII